MSTHLIAQQRLIDEVARRMDGALQVGHTRTAQILNIDPDTLTAEGDAGQIKFRARGKRRIYTLPFIVEYLATPAKQAETCQSTGAKTSQVRRPRKSTTMTSCATVVGFRAAREKRLSEKRR